MARLARLVVPGLPHLVTQRGNRGERTFFTDADYALYRDLIGAAANRAGTAVWAYCLMPNHVHLVLVPSRPDGLRAMLAEAHRRYTLHVNRRNGWTGHLWQGRFGSVAMDEAHLIAAVRYVSLNPVRAQLVARAEDWRWSSVRAHLRGADDALMTVAPMLARVPDVAALLDGPLDAPADAALRRAETIGRPVGDAAFIGDLEARTGRTLAARRPGRPARGGKGGEG
jgi:putative transposase